MELQGKDTERDDLTRITGIGTSRQLWLEETFGIRTYADLAAVSADEIISRLVADGKPYSRDEVEGWIREAAELAPKKEDTVSELSVEASGPVPAYSPRTEFDPGKGTAPVFGAEQWRRLAFFQVEYQKRQPEGAAAEQRTLINYHEIDQWHEWPHIETEGLGQWIVEQAGEILRLAEDQVPDARPEPETTFRPLLTVTRVRIYQPAGKEVTLAHASNGRPHSGFVRADLPFAMEIDSELSDGEAATERREIPYRAQFYAHNRMTGEKIHLGNSAPGLLVSGEVSSASLTQIALPRGRYRLQALILPKREDMAPGYMEVPLLEVI